MRTVRSITRPKPPSVALTPSPTRPRMPATLRATRPRSPSTSPLSTINLTVADDESAASDLTLTGTSSNTTLVPNTAQNITFGGSGQNRTMQVSAVGNKSGTAQITVKVSDQVSLSDTLIITAKVGTAKSETLSGTTGADMLFGLAKNDTLNALGGNDLLCGGDGNDVLNGGDHADTLFGGRGNDTLTGASGADLFSGGLGNDVATDFNASQEEGDTMDNTIP